MNYGRHSTSNKKLSNNIKLYTYIFYNPTFMKKNPSLPYVIRINLKYLSINY